MNQEPNEILAEYLSGSAGASDDSKSEGLSQDSELILEQILADPGLLQHLSRTRRDGIETIVAYYRCTFAPGQQRVVLHVPFSPPFATMPQIDASIPEDSSARVRLTDQQKFGVRLEIVLPNVAELETSHLVEMIASAEA